MLRLLFDEPLSERLCEMLADVFPQSFHVRLLGRGGASDEAIRELAIAHGCIVVSKDSDFHRLTVLRGAPPKFIWIRLGNCRTDDVAKLLRDNFVEIVRFEAAAEASVFEIG